jgi:hypothetical protein
MKVTNVRKLKSEHPVKVLDMFVDDGYLQGGKPNMPDVC